MLPGTRTEIAGRPLAHARDNMLRIMRCRGCGHTARPGSEFCSPECERNHDDAEARRQSLCADARKACADSDTL